MLQPTRQYPSAWELLLKIVGEYTWRDWLSGRGYLLDPPALDRLDEVRAPTLIVNGAADLPRFRAVGELLARSIPGSRYELIPGAAHLPNLEKPVIFNQLLLDFARQIGHN